MRCETVLVIHAFEYHGERIVEYKGKRYHIERASEGKYGRIELTIGEVIGVGGESKERRRSDGDD